MALATLIHEMPWQCVAATRWQEPRNRETAATVESGAPVCQAASGGICPRLSIFRDFKDTVYPLLESDTLFLECRLYCV